MQSSSNSIPNWLIDRIPKAPRCRFSVARGHAICLFVYLSIHSFIRPFVYSSIRPFARHLSIPLRYPSRPRTCNARLILKLVYPTFRTRNARLILKLVYPTSRTCNARHILNSVYPPCTRDTQLTQCPPHPSPVSSSIKHTKSSLRRNLKVSLYR